MEEDMVEDAFMDAFEAYEVDLDYEFDAPRFFNFSREESLHETQQAELWFQSARSYPHSPFAEKLIMSQGIAMCNVNVSPKSKGFVNMALLDDDYDNDLVPEATMMDITNKESGRLTGGISTKLQQSRLLPAYNHRQMSTGPTNCERMITNPKEESKSVKPRISRTSTLMKPTASHLAKKHAPSSESRFQPLPTHGFERSLNNSSLVESQAAKRQKLEGGHLRKVGDSKHQMSFIHKEPKKEGIGSSLLIKPRITIPREPDLETSQRAHRIKSFRPRIGTEPERVLSTATKFKARPLNRKILETPSLPLAMKSTPRLPEFQEFHLKTSERASQHSSTVSSSLLRNNKFEKGSNRPPNDSCFQNVGNATKRSNFTNVPKCDAIPKFKALPLNKKIFTSKGEIGVFRNNKQSPTVPVEFNFQTEKRIHQGPPVDLFSKLSLSSACHSDAACQLTLPRPTPKAIKGSKENRLGYIQQEHVMTRSTKEKYQSFGEKQIQYGSIRGTSFSGTHSGIGRIR